MLQITDDFTEELQKSIQDIYHQTLQQARRDAGASIEYMTRNQVMEVFEVSNNTLTNWISKGLPVVKVGQKVFFKKSDLYDFFERHKIE